jgi:hypothetical protein
MSDFHVRRDKAALFQWVQAPPGGAGSWSARFPVLVDPWHDVWTATTRRVCSSVPNADGPQKKTPPCPSERGPWNHECFSRPVARRRLGGPRIARRGMFAIRIRTPKQRGRQILWGALLGLCNAVELRGGLEYLVVPLTTMATQSGGFFRLVNHFTHAH